MFAAPTCAFLCCLLNFTESRGQEACHFADSAGTASVETQRIERYADVGVAGYRIAKSLRQRCFPGANIASENEKWRAVAKKLNDPKLLAMMFAAPFGEALRIKEQPGLFQQALFHVVEADEGRKTSGG